MSEPTKDGVAASGLRLTTALMLKAVEGGAAWSIEGSADWTDKDGRLTVWIDLPEDEWDLVYDALDAIDKDGTSTVSLKEAEPNG